MNIIKSPEPVFEVSGPSVYEEIIFIFCNLLPDKPVPDIFEYDLHSHFLCGFQIYPYI
jgi:hypothetical protein